MSPTRDEMSMTRLAAAAVSAAAIALIAACGVPTVVPAPPPGSGRPVPTTVAPVTTIAAKAGSAANPLPFGQTYIGESLNATISAPLPYAPTPNQFEHRPARCVVVTVTVTNTSKTTAVPATLMVVQATASGAQAVAVIDIGQDVGGATTDILPGRSLSWREAFGVPEASPGQTDFVVQVSSVAGGATAYFAGRI